MAAIEIESAQCTRDGAALPTQAEADGSTELALKANDGLVLVEVENPTSGPLTITFDKSATVGGDAIPGEAKTVAAGATRWFGPYPPALYTQDDGSLTCSADAGLLLRALRI